METAFAALAGLSEGMTAEQILLDHAAECAALARIVTDDGMIAQVWHLLFAALGRPYPTPEQRRSVLYWAEVLADFAAHFAAIVPIYQDMLVLVRALVRGNQGIYRNMAWAAQVFLQGEADGGRGLERLDAWCDAGPDHPLDLHPRDPQRFLRDSLALYRQCRELWFAAQAETDPARRAAILEQRKALTHKANVVIGCQEQMMILQSPEVFSQPTMERIVAAQQGAMLLHDPGLVPSEGPVRRIALATDGNWADFPERMGVTPGTGELQISSGATGTAGDTQWENWATARKRSCAG